MILMPGVVSHATNLVEHPQLVADRILRYTAIVGRENVIAGTDCGPGGRVHSELAWAKLRALVEERNSLRRTSGGAKFSGLGKPESRRDFLGGRFAGGGIVGALGQLR